MSSGVIGGAAAAAVAAAIAVAVGLVWLFRLRRKRLSNRNSDTGSSDPSALVEWSRGEGRGGGAGTSGGSGQVGPARLFGADELERATKRFSEGNLIGYGGFGSVYKGLLDDGTVVAVKRRSGPPKTEFSTEAVFLSEIRHRNLVSLIGYCQENGSQMLIFEYLPNGSVCNHLYHDTSKDPSTKLEFKQRVSIALGAAKGLSHLHGLKPQMLHKNFKTANVLVDENLIAKVSDAGIANLLEKIEEAGSSRASSFNVFHDPEVGISNGVATETSDVYSFGVFLLELVTGQEAIQNDILGSNESLVQWVESRLSINNFVDHRMDGSFTMEGMRDLIRLTLQCMSFPGKRRPNMENVVAELERIREKEMELTTVMGEGTATITLGSQLFS